MPTTSGSGMETMSEETTMDMADSSSGGAGGVHQAMIQPIWDANCNMTGCHTAGGAFPDLSDGVAYANIVGVMSMQVDMSLVTASDLDNSYLWRKLDGTFSDIPSSDGSDNATTMMPLVGMLSSDDMDTLMMWISDGAPE